MNILHLTPDFNYSDGRSYYVFLLLKYLKRAGHNVFLCSNGGDSFDRLSEYEIPVFINSMLATKSKFINSINYISKIIDDNKIDIIHSHHRYFELLANSVRRKSVHTVFTSLSIVDKRYFVEYKSDKIIAVSRCIKDMLIIKFGVDENKIHIIPNFTDTEEVSVITAANTIEKKKDTTNILAVGRFHKEKNFETLLRAISLLKEFRIKLFLIGEGDEKISYEKIILEESIDVNVIPPQKDLSSFFHEADICVLSSVRDPLPGFMLQSGLHKKAFIGSDTDGISEVITNEVTGLLFERRNASELAEKIKLFIENKNLSQDCADNLNKLILNNYTEQTVIPQIEDLYRSFHN